MDHSCRLVECEYGLIVKVYGDAGNPVARKLNIVTAREKGRFASNAALFGCSASTVAA